MTISEMIKTTVKAPGYLLFTFDNFLTLEEIRITWGRESLFTEPANRRLQVQYLAIPQIMEGVSGTWVGAQIAVSVKFDHRPPQPLFQGRIDRISIQPIDIPGKPPWLITITATEAPTWSNVLNSEQGGAKSLTSYGARRRRALEAIPRLEVLDGYEIDLREPGSSFLTTRQIVESLVCRPGAFPVWSPDWEKVAPSAYDLTRPAVVTSLSAAEVIDSGGEVSFDAPGWPTTIIYQEGGVFGTDKASSGDAVIRNTFDQWDRGYVTTITNKYCPTIENGSTLNRARPHIELVKAQLTSPRRFTLDSSVTPRLITTDALWATWENPNRRLQITGDRYAAALKNAIGAVQDYIPIGGTLSIYHDHVEHDLTCLWGKTDTTVWAAQVGTWAAQKHTWKGN